MVIWKTVIKLIFSVVDVDSKAASISVLNPTNAKDLRTFSYDHTYDLKQK